MDHLETASCRSSGWELWEHGPGREEGKAVPARESGGQDPQEGGVW